MRVAVGIVLAVLATPATAEDWSGFYAGITAGHAWADAEQKFTYNYVVPLDPKGFLGGVYAGYQHSAGPIVIGVEGDFTLGDVSSRNVHGIAAGSPDPAYQFHSDMKWSTSLRARVGVPVGRFLPYVAGGLAAARFQHSQTTIDPYAVTRSYTGWTIGGGVDYAATENVAVRLEYRFSDFGSRSFSHPDPAWWSDHTVKLQAKEVRLGVSWRW